MLRVECELRRVRNTESAGKDFWTFNLAIQPTFLVVLNMVRSEVLPGLVLDLLPNEHMRYFIHSNNFNESRLEVVTIILLVNFETEFGALLVFSRFHSKILFSAFNHLLKISESGNSRFAVGGSVSAVDVTSSRVWLYDKISFGRESGYLVYRGR